jgi:hypothetical protein
MADSILACFPHRFTFTASLSSANHLRSTSISLITATFLFYCLLIAVNLRPSKPL